MIDRWNRNMKWRMFPCEHRDDKFELALMCRDVLGSSLFELELIVFVYDHFYTWAFVLSVLMITFALEHLYRSFVQHYENDISLHKMVWQDKCSPGRVDGWLDGWICVKAVLRIAYGNQNLEIRFRELKEFYVTIK